MEKKKLRFRDIWNRWYTWVLALILMFARIEFSSASIIHSWEDFFKQTGDEAGLFCLNEFPGLYLNLGATSFFANFMINLLIVFALLAIIWAITNKLREPNNF